MPGESTYQLQHAFGDGDGDQTWQDCGVLKTRVTDKTTTSNAKKGKKNASATFHGIKVAYDKLTKQSKSQLIETAKEADGYYRVRISTTPLEESDKASLEYVITSVKASCLVAAEYRVSSKQTNEKKGKKGSLPLSYTRLSITCNNRHNKHRSPLSLSLSLCYSKLFKWN